MKLNHDHAYAYALGYWDGRSKGIESNGFKDSENRMAYDWGYERGVTDYSEGECDEQQVDR
jgi:hypothetical protein